MDSRAKVLVLGPNEAAEWISDGLKEEGFEPHLAVASFAELPSPIDPRGISALRQTLVDFRSRQPEGSELLIHPGVSDWAERPELPILAQELGFEAICPSAKVLNLFANKLSLLAEGERIGIPNLLIHPNPLTSVREIEQLMQNQGSRFPLILKAIKGGRGAGHFVLHDRAELQTKVPLWMEQLERTCGEVMWVAERYLEGSRLLVIPFARLKDGTFEAFPGVDASLQCRYRKLVEFCPAFGVEPSVEKRARDWADEFARSTNFVGVGTLEFLVDGNRAFLVNGAARLNTSFRLWEAVAQTRAVAWQIGRKPGRGASRGASEAHSGGKRWNFALMARLFAEDPLLQLPQPGVAYEVSDQRRWEFPTAAARAEISLKSGERIPYNASGMIGLLCVGANERKQALTVARGILEEVWIAGSLQTNSRFIAELLSHPWVREGIFYAGFVDEEFLPAIRPPVELIQVFAGICASLSVAKDGAKEDAAVRWSVGDQWAKPDLSGWKWLDGGPISIGGNPGASGWIELAGEQRFRACAYPVSEDRWQTRIGMWVLSVRRAQVRPKENPSKKRPMVRRPKILALVSGRIHAILFREGSLVPAHETLLIIESLGQLIPHALPTDVRINRWKFHAEEIVNAGDELADFELAHEGI